MKKHVFLTCLCLVAVALLFLTACNNDDNDHSHHGRLAVEHLTHINDNLHGRFAFSDREHETAMWIVSQLIAMGHSADNIEMQSFHRDRLPDGHVAVDAAQRDYSQNIILTVPGQSGRIIVVGASYDGLRYGGVSSNAAGTALLLESAQNILEQEHHYTIMYVFFGAGMLSHTGAAYFHETLPWHLRENIMLMINADALLEGTHLVYGAGYNQGDIPGANAVTTRIDIAAVYVRETYDATINPIRNMIFSNNAHLPFTSDGHTVMFLTSFYLPETGGFASPIHRSRYDNLEHLNANWPDKVQNNMRQFAVFLEQVLLSAE